MSLQGQGRTGRDEGYALAALLVSLGVMAVMMSVALPVWRQQTQREKEGELIFRGEQYARAIGLYQRKFAGAFPPSIDLLVEQRFLRKKYKDPMTEEGEFQLLYATSQTSQQQAQPGAAQPGAAGIARQPVPVVQGPAPTDAGPGRATPGALGGLIGVASKSKERSIRLYKGRGRYNDWHFIFTPVTTQPGAVPGQQRPGMPPQGTPSTRPGGRPPTAPGGAIRPPGIGPGSGPGRPPGQQPRPPSLPPPTRPPR